MLPQTRRNARELLGVARHSHWWTWLAFTLCAAAAGAVALLPTHEGLADSGRWALFILVFCAGLWITEAIPAVAVSLLAIGLEIAILGRPGGVYATGPNDWEVFIAPWGSPLIWLFFGGFCLAAAAKETALDRWMALRAIGLFGARPALLLLGVMSVTALLSMFLSNTATATLMVAVLGPLIASRPEGDRCVKAVLVTVAIASNLGGMGTVIGTPPNAIAAGVIADGVEQGLIAPERVVGFADWMMLAAPPMLLMLVVCWACVTLAYLGRDAFSPLTDLSLGAPPVESVPRIRQLVVVATFAATVLMWIASPWHGIPTTVVSFIPICALTSTGVLSGEDLRGLPWDILLLIAGGLSLGVAISMTGLAEWLVTRLPFEGLGPFATVLGFGYLMVVMSNLMSNTAAANIVLPLTLAATSPVDARYVVPVALCASAAMCLPISTPPNAIVYGTRLISSRDLLAAGLLTGLLVPVIATLWCCWLLPVR